MGAETPEVTKLLEQVREGDRGALERLLEKVQPQVYRYGMRMCRHPEDAEDILQETLISLARRLPEFRGDSALSTYVYAVARSHCLKKRRKSKFAPEHVDAVDTVSDELHASTGDQHEELTRKEEWGRVSEALAGIEPQYKEIIVLRDIEGLSAAEVSEVTGASVGAVKSRLHRARKALRDALGTERPLPGCPDIVEVFSRNLEGELDATHCAEMEAHLSECPRCRGVCDALKFDLRVCQLAPTADVPSEVQSRIQTKIRAALHSWPTAE